MKFQIAKTGWWRCGLVWALKDWESARRGDHRLIGPTPPALREINYYAAVYSQDGVVQVQIKTELGGWVDVQS